MCRAVITEQVRAGRISVENGYIEVGRGGVEVVSSVGFMDLIQPNICDGRGPQSAKTVITQPSFLKHPSEVSTQVFTPVQHGINT